MATSIAGGRIAAGVGANLIGQHAQARNQEATVYVGNLDTQVSEEIVWELFVQAGPVANVYMPKDRVTNTHQGYGFVEFKGEEDADYAIKILNMIKLFGKPIRVNKASQDKQTLNVGANLFIGNLDADVDEKLLYDTFSAFGVIIQTPKIKRDENTGASKGFGFVSYDCFEASDAAIEAMNGQFLMNRQITVMYAYKVGQKGERHGDPAERLLAAQQRANQAQQSRPHTLFATGPRQAPETVENPAAISNPTTGFAAGSAAPLPPAPPPEAAPPMPPTAPWLQPQSAGAPTMPPAAPPAAPPLPAMPPPAPPAAVAPPAPAGAPPPPPGYGLPVPGAPPAPPAPAGAPGAPMPPPGFRPQGAPWGPGGPIRPPPPGMPAPPPGYGLRPGMQPPPGFAPGMPPPPAGYGLPRGMPGALPPGMPPRPLPPRPLM